MKINISKMMKEHQVMKERLIETDDVVEFNGSLVWGPDGDLLSKGQKVKPVKIVWFRDSNNDMEKLEVNGKCVGYGNPSDDHCEDQVKALKIAFDHIGIKYKYSIDDKWNWGS